MRIVMDTGDLRNLASIARNCSNTLGAINGDVRRTRHTVHLNTRDDAALRRRQPHDAAVGIERELSGLQSEYADRARSYEQRAQRIENTERIQWRPFPLPIIIGLPQSWTRIPTQPVLPHFAGLLPQTGGQVPLWTLPLRSAPNLTVIGLVARRAPSLLEQGVGLIGRGIDALRRGFTTVTDRLVETAADAWNRIWSRTAQTLQAVVAGLRNIVVSGVRVAVDGVRSAATTVGRWIIDGAKGIWSIVGNYWERVAKIAEQVLTLLDAFEVWEFAITMGWAKANAFVSSIAGFGRVVSKKLPWLGMFLGGALAIKDFMDFGIGDARVWQSIFEVVGGIAAAGAMIAVGAPAALGLIALSVGVLIGTLIANYVTVPLYNNWYDSRNPPAPPLPPAPRRPDAGPTPSPQPVFQAPPPRVGVAIGKLPNSTRTSQEAFDAYDADWSERMDGYFGKGGPGEENQYQCVPWVWFRLREHMPDFPFIPVGGGGQMAQKLANEYGRSSTETPRLGAIISFDDRSGGGYGHVVFAEEISEVDGRLTIRYSEMNFAGPRTYQSSSLLVQTDGGGWEKVSADGRRTPIAAGTLNVFNPDYPK